MGANARPASDSWQNLWRIAGSLHLGPCDLKELTLRQLVWMCEGRDRHVWSVASSLMALIANCHRDSKGKKLSPDDFNPMLTKAERNRDAILITDDNVELMRDEFKRSISCDVKLTPIEEHHE